MLLWLGHARFFYNSMDYSPPGYLSMGFSKQEYWNRLPFLPSGDLPDPGHLPDPGLKPASTELTGGFFIA